MTDSPVAKKSAFVTLISLWLKAPEDVQRRVLQEARKLARDRSLREGEEAQ
jgi:hypothetical protein